MLLTARIIKVEYADGTSKAFKFEGSSLDNNKVSNFLYAQGKRWLSWTEIDRKYKEV